MQLVCEFFDISKPNIAMKTSCNKGAIKKCTDKIDDKAGVKDHLCPDHDAQVEMHEALRALPFKPTFDG